MTSYHPRMDAMLGTPATSVIDLRGTKVYLRRAGKGPPLLFLHGVMGLGFPGWLPVFASLAEQFEVYAPDHPGFGLSDTPNTVDDVSDLALFYLDLLDALALPDPPHIVGECLGGWAALEIAIRCATAPKSLTLIASAGIRVPGVPAADIFLPPANKLPSLLYAGENGERWMAAWQSSDEMHDLYEKNRAAAAKYCWQPRFYNPKLAHWLHRIKVPTHVIWGELDRVIPPVYAAKFAELIPGAKITMIPGCGHLAGIEQPEVVSQSVIQFIGAGVR